MISIPITIHLGAFAILTLLLSAVQSTILIPKPNGPYNTRITSAKKLVDETRLDPFAPNRTQRAIMVTVFYPIKTPSECDPLHTVTYMPLATAQFWDSVFAEYDVTNATLEKFGISACRPNATIGPSYDGNDQPIVIFPPEMTVSLDWIGRSCFSVT